MAKSALVELQNTYRQYLAACELWKAFLENIKTHSEEVSGSVAPIISEDLHRVSYFWTQTEIFCHFYYGRFKASIDFGYREKNLSGRQQDFLMETIYFDARGNVRDNPEQPTSSCNITHFGDLEKFFFPQLLTTLEKSQKHDPYEYKY